MTENFFQNEVGSEGAPMQKNAAYYRACARGSLRGKWGTAVWIGLVAVMLGGLVSGSVNISFDPSNFDFDLLSVESGAVIDRNAFDWLMNLILIGIATVALSSVAYALFVASPLKLGYQRVNLDLIDGKGLQFKTLFSYFKINYLRSVRLNLLFSLLVKMIVILPAIALAWVSLDCVDELLASLVVVDGKLEVLDFDWNVLHSHILWIAVLGCVTAAMGIVSAVLNYTYRFAYMAMAEYPDMGAIEAMRVSRNMMRGNKWRLFCLDFSFIGWTILASIFTLGIGMLWVYPYREAAIATFYDDVTNRRTARVTEFPSLNFDDYMEEEQGSVESEKPLSEENTEEEEKDKDKPTHIDFTAMPFTAELEFPSLDLDDYPTDGEQK